MSSRNPTTPADAGQAEHLADITREVLAIASLIERAGQQYGSDDLMPGHADSWRLDLDLVAAERAIRSVRSRNAEWRRQREVAVFDAVTGLDIEEPLPVRKSGQVPGPGATPEGRAALDAQGVV